MRLAFDVILFVGPKLARPFVPMFRKNFIIMLTQILVLRNKGMPEFARGQSICIIIPLINGTPECGNDKIKRQF